MKCKTTSISILVSVVLVYIFCCYFETPGHNFDYKCVVSTFKGSEFGDGLQAVCMHICMQVLPFYWMSEEIWLYLRFSLDEQVGQ